MKTNNLRFIIVVGLILLPALSHAVDVNFNVFKAAVCQVESGCNDGKIGTKGERGRYQFMEATWKQYTNLPHSAAHVQSNSEMVMDKHCRWMMLALKRLGREVTVKNLALLHNAGYGNMERRTIKASNYDYAERVNAVYIDLLTPKIVK